MTPRPAPAAAQPVPEMWPHHVAADQRRYQAELDRLLADTAGQPLPKLYAVYRPGEPWRCGVAVEYRECK